MRAQSEFLVEVDVRIVVALAAGESGCEQRLAEVAGGRNANAAAIQIRSQAALGDEELITRGVVDYGGNERAVLARREIGGALFEAHRDAKYRVAMGEVCGAVERVDVPAVFVVDAVAGALFAVDAVLGKLRVEALDYEALAGAIGFGDEVDFALVLGGYGAVVEIAHQSAGFERDGRGGTGERQINVKGKNGRHQACPGTSGELRLPDRLRTVSRLAASVMVRI